MAVKLWKSWVVQSPSNVKFLFVILCWTIFLGGWNCKWLLGIWCLLFFWFVWPLQPFWLWPFSVATDAPQCGVSIGACDDFSVGQQSTLWFSTMFSINVPPRFLLMFHPAFQCDYNRFWALSPWWILASLALDSLINDFDSWLVVLFSFSRF